MNLVEIEYFDSNLVFGVVIHGNVDLSEASLSNFIEDGVFTDAGVWDIFLFLKELMICES